MSPRERRALAAILAAGFIARALFCWLFPQTDPNNAIPNPDDYSRLALALVDHGGLLDEAGRPSARREPMYPAFLAAVFAISRTYRAAQAAQCVISTVNIWLVFLLGRLLFTSRTGLIAAAIAAVYPQFIFYTGSMQRETFMILTTLAGLLWLARSIGKPSAAAYAGAGALQAVNALTNTALLPFAGLAPAVVLWLHRRDPRRWLWAVSCAAGFAVLYGVWVIRNFQHFGALIIGSTTGGGNNLYVYQIVPMELAGTPEQALISESDPVMVKAMAMSEIERDKYLYKEGIRLAKERPFRFVWLCFRRFLKLWRLYPYARDYSFDYRLILAASLATDGWIVPLAAAGAWLARLRHPGLAYVYLFVGATSGVYAVLWAMIRYRMPMMAPAIVLCAFALGALWDRDGR